jgi:hypothetical protein
VDSVIYARFRGDPMRTPPPEFDARQASAYVSEIKSPALFTPAVSDNSQP